MARKFFKIIFLLILQELVTAIARVFGMLDEEVYDAVINHSDELAHTGWSCNP